MTDDNRARARNKIWPKRRNSLLTLDIDLNMDLKKTQANATNIQEHNSLLNKYKYNSLKEAEVSN